MTYTVTKKTTKKQLQKMLASLPDKRKPVDFSKYYGTLKLPKDFDVLEWQRRNRDDGTYNY